jgi:hypothetical protein
VWVKEPHPDAVQAQGYVDGSRLDGEHDLHGLCARQGWAFAAFDNDDELVAAAHGRTPWWAEGIHATELWGLLKAVQTLDPGCPLLVDCQAVQIGSQKGEAWAIAPSRAFARAWGPVAAALEEATDRVSWMPAHNAATGLEHKKRSDGKALTKVNVVGNDLVDKLAKEAAKAAAAPKEQLSWVRAGARKLTEAAVWAAKATAFANNCPLDSLVTVDPGEKRKFVRDSTALPARRRVRGPGLAQASAAALPPPTLAVARSRIGAAPKRKHVSMDGATATPSELATAGRRAKVARLASRAVADTEQRRLDRWLADRPPCTSPQVTAAERLAALKERLAARRSLTASAVAASWAAVATARGDPPSSVAAARAPEAADSVA